jgi:RNA polymerase sigma factor (sigma-70 family)
VPGLRAAGAEDELRALVARAKGGERKALDLLLARLADGLYRLGLRMTANPADAEDATQEALLKVATHLGTFREEASVRTWAYRIAVNHLLERRRSAVEAIGLDFERFAADLADGLGAASGDADAATEVKLGCTLAMLTCLDREHRVAYILGDVFDLPSAEAAEVAGVAEPAYRQRLSRARRQLEAFTESYCGVVSVAAACRCDKRVARAIELGRVERHNLRLAAHPVSGAAPKVENRVAEMEALHATAALFRSHPDYAAPGRIAGKVAELLDQGDLDILR